MTTRHACKKKTLSHGERLMTGERSPKSSSTYLSMLCALRDLAARTRGMLPKITEK